MEQNKSNLKVIIVGGSIAGLTLAHCLSRLKIDYVVLERQNEIAPQVGASVSLMPNGARIIDQLGMFDTLFEGVEPCIFMRTWTGDGKLLSETDSPILTGKRLGYTITFVERERLLQVLYDHLPDKSKVLTGKQVNSVKQNEKEAVVYCADGSKFSGDIIAGADGVRSFIRAEMRRQIAAEGTPSDLEALEKDKKSLSAEYNCLFGISKPIKGLDIGKTHRSLSQGASTLLFTGAEGLVYWFLFAQTPERLFDSNIPRYSKSDEAKHAAKFSKHHVTGEILFSTLWEHRIVANFVAIEEMENEHWVWNRVACLGDSVHKMTPNLGQGANCAIESAAELANQIAKFEASRKGKPSYGEITKALHSYHQERRTRANLIVKIANKFTRIEALATRGDWMASMYILPRLGDILADRGCKVQVGATKLDFLKMPERALQGTMPWSRQSGVGKEENRKRRAQFALPLLLASFGFYWISRTATAQGLLQINNAISSNIIELSNGKKVPLFRDYFGFAAIDDRIATYVSKLMLQYGSDWKIHTLSAMSTNLSMVVIWTIESFRRGNVLTFANFFPTLLLLLAQSKGSAIIAPVYYFFHYLQSPQENYAALDNRLTNMTFVKTFIPVLALIYVLPFLYVYTTADLQQLQWLYGYTWYLFPVYLTVALRILSLVVKDTTSFDRLYKPTADLPYLHFIYSTCIAFCGSAHLYMQSFTKDLSFRGFSESFARKSVSLITSGPTNLAELWEANRLVTFGATLFWILLSFSDLKRARRLQAGWFRILGILILSTVAAGPDAAVLIMWAWREQAMAKKAALEM